MPIYIDLSNLIIPKSIIEERYNGGLDSFRDRFINSNNPRNQEDDELFQIAKMNPDEFNFQIFESEGLYLKKGDYDIINKYGYQASENWLKIKFPFIYHSNCEPMQIKLAHHLASMTMDVIMKEQEKGFSLTQEINKTTITNNEFYKKLISQDLKHTFLTKKEEKNYVPKKEKDFVPSQIKNYQIKSWIDDFFSSPWSYVIGIPLGFSIPVILWYLLRIVVYIISFIIFGRGFWDLD